MVWYILHVIRSCVWWLTDKIISYLKEWEGSIEKRNGFSPQSKSIMVLAKETHKEINITSTYLLV